MEEEEYIYTRPKGTYKVRNKIETKRNETKRNEFNENETKRNQQKRNETKRNQRNENEIKRNQRKQYEINLFLYFVLSFIFVLPFSSYQSISFCFR
jgi:hypothetical protein